MKIPYIKQHDEADCGAACLSMVCMYYGLKLFIRDIRSLIKTDSFGTTLYGIVDGAQKLGFESNALKGNYSELMESIIKKEIKLPFIAHVILNEQTEHYIVIYKITNNYIIYADPANGIRKCSINDFCKIWTGYIITFNSGHSLKKINKTKGGNKKFWSLVTHNPNFLIALLVLSVIISAATSISTYVMKYIVDIIQGGESKYQISTLCIYLVMVFLVIFVLQIINSNIIVRFSRKINHKLVHNYFSHLMNLPLNFFLNRKSGDLISRFNDISVICNTLVDIILTFYVDIILLVVYSIFMIRISLNLYIVSMLLVVLYMFLVYLFKKPIKSNEYDARIKGAELTSNIKEAMDGIETIKTFNVEDKTKNKLFFIFSDYFDSIAKISILSFWQNGLVNFLTSSGVVIVLCYGTKLCLNNSLNFGELLTFYMLLGSFFTPLSAIINLQPKIQSFYVSAERLNDILEEKQEEITNYISQSLNDDILFDNVNFRYGSRDLILKNINFKIKKGNKVAIVGESGCGKTTLSKLLLGLYDYNGQIYIGSKSQKEISKKTLRNKIAYINQNTYIFSDTIKENICLGSKVQDEDMFEILKLCNLEKFVMSQPYGLDSIINENGNNLSNGQKQKLFIARALVKKPDILVLDEATCNIDPIAELEIHNVLNSLRNRLTIIIISHKISNVVDCDKIFVMSNGEIIEAGDHNDLISKKGIYKAMFDASKFE